MQTAAETGSITSIFATIRRLRQTAMIAKLKDILHTLAETDCDTAEAWRDPLSHPAIRAMSARELADLPFQTNRRK